MKLVIENYIETEDLIIQNLCVPFPNWIPFSGLTYKDKRATKLKFSHEGVMKIFTTNKVEGNLNRVKKYIFYNDEDKLLQTIEGTECYITISNNKISNFGQENYLKYRRELVVLHNKFIPTQWNTYWYYLHWLCYNYPNNPTEEDKNQIIDLVTDMRNDGIKCGKCRGHFDEWLNKNDINPYLESQDKLFDYFFTLHNDVNKRNEKKLFTKDEAIALFRDKDWNQVFKKYQVDIMELLLTRNLKNFPKLFYTTIEENLRKEIGIKDVQEKLKNIQKFQMDSLEGKKRVVLTENMVAVEDGWNLIGSRSNRKLKSDNITSNLIYEFDNGYKQVNDYILKEGKGYWIRCGNAGYIEYEN